MNLGIKNKIKILAKSIFFLALFAFAVKGGAVWMPPSSSAPGNNTKPPINEGTFTQFKNGNFVAQGLKATTASILEGTLQIPGGIPPLEGKVLTSDGIGMASWQILTGGPGGGDVTAPPTTGGTTNYVTKWTGTHAIGDSQIYDNGTRVGIATATPDTNSKLDVNGKVKMTGFQMNVGTQPLAGKVLTTDEFGNGSWQALGGCGTSGGWTKSGNVVRLTNSTDKVGIGFENCPEAADQQLEITKNFKIPNTTVNGDSGVIYTSYLTNQRRLLSNYSGSNIYLGENAGSVSSSSQGVSEAIAIGVDSMENPQSGNANIAIGHRSVVSDIGSNNIALGNASSDSSYTGSDNISMGEQAFIIDLASSYSGGPFSFTQNGNVSIGRAALWSYQLTDPADVVRSYNTAVGKGTFAVDLRNASNNTALGQDSKSDFNDIQNSTVIGKNSSINSNNIMVFGIKASTNEYGYQNVYTKKWGLGVNAQVANAFEVGDDAINGNGASLTKEGEWTSGSDRTKKHNIKDTSYGLEEVMQLRPVSFDWNGTNTHDVGFIAQEVKEIIPEVVSGVEGEMTLSYSQINSVLAKAVQELKEENEILKYETYLLEKELE